MKNGGFGHRTETIRSASSCLTGGDPVSEMTDTFGTRDFGSAARVIERTLPMGKSLRKVFPAVVSTVVSN